MDAATSTEYRGRDSELTADDSAPARGIFYGVALGVISWLVVAVVALTG